MTPEGAAGRSSVRELKLSDLVEAAFNELNSEIAALKAENARLKVQLAEITAKERREFAWAEEYMAKSRHLEVENEWLRSALSGRPATPAPKEQP